MVQGLRVIFKRVWSGIRIEEECVSKITLRFLSFGPFFSFFKNFTVKFDERW